MVSYLNPLDNLTLTLDFWSIKKKDTIGLFGEENHTLLDLLDSVEQGVSNCVNFQSVIPCWAEVKSMTTIFRLPRRRDLSCRRP